MECKLIKGQHVLCIADPCDPLMYPRLHHYPRIGTVYTVRTVNIDPIRGYPVITLIEIAPQLFFMPLYWRTAEMAWMASAFKPLEKLKVENFMTEDLEVDA